MFSKKMFWGSLAGLVLLTGTSTLALAEMPVHLEQSSQFHYIEQPWSLKVGVAIGGFALIGLELWWFLLYVADD